MPEFFHLRFQIPFIRRIRLYDKRDAVYDFQSVRFETHAFAWVIRDETHAAYAEVRQDLSADAVVARVGLESEMDVRLHGIESLILQGVCANFIDQANAAALLPH